MSIGVADVVKVVEPATVLDEGLRRGVVGDDCGAVAAGTVTGDGEGGGGD